MPPIPLQLAARIASAMLAEANKGGARAIDVNVISREDHLSIWVEGVEHDEMTASAYDGLVTQLRTIAAEMSGER